MKKTICTAGFAFAMSLIFLSCANDNGAVKFEGKWIQASRASEQADSIPGLIITKNTDSFMVQPINMKSFDEKLSAYYNKDEDKLIVTKAGGIKYNDKTKTIMLDGGREFSKATE